MRTPLIAGNWKMHTTLPEAVALASDIASCSRQYSDREVVLAPPFTALASIAAAVTDSDIILAGQNCAWEKAGAFTGEISPPMLMEIGCRMAIIGHSERRHIFHEPDDMINRRLRGAAAGGLTPILCIGETLEEREADRTFEVLERQLRSGLNDFEYDQAGLIAAYEPVWAIGTGKTATESQAQEVHAFLRSLLADIFEKDIAGQIRILYGGSVKPENIDLLMAQQDIDGVLVGGAALEAQSFCRIIGFQ
jgi:triosephosphate isomerase